MACAGIGWAAYSLRGRTASQPVASNAESFRRALPLSLAVSLLTLGSARADLRGALLAVASGAVASGIGYSIWYTALPRLKVASAATAQLSVPVIAAIGGIALLGEEPTLRFLLASLAILGGIALVVIEKQQDRTA